MGRKFHEFIFARGFVDEGKFYDFYAWRGAFGGVCNVQTA
jgi:hypothetical protein